MTLAEKRKQENAWYLLNRCRTVRCPLHCAEPRPFFCEGLMWCSACWEFGLMTEVIPVREDPPATGGDAR